MVFVVLNVGLTFLSSSNVFDYFLQLIKLKCDLKTVLLDQTQ